MAKIVRTERYRRGLFGWLFRIIFWTFNLIMLAWVATYWGALSGVHVDGPHAEATRVGTAIGGTIGTGVIMVFWAMGAFILGLLVLFTRGRKTIIEERID
jgi:Kef-type K+ transport system membrane component KefB